MSLPSTHATFFPLQYHTHARFACNGRWSSLPTPCQDGGLLSCDAHIAMTVLSYTQETSSDSPIWSSTDCPITRRNAQMNGSRFDWPDTSSVLREKKESERFLGGKITGSRWKISFFRGRHGILFFISLSFVSFFSSSTLMALRLGMRHSMTRPIRHSDTGDQGGGRRWTDQPQTIRTRQPRDVAIVCFAVVVNDERKKNRPPVKRRRRRRVGGQHAPDEMQRNIFFFFPKSEKKNVCVCVRCFAWNEKKRKEKRKFSYFHCGRCC